MSFSYRIESGFMDDVFGGTGLSGRFDTRPVYPEIEVTTEPTIDPVTLTEIKNEIRVRHAQDDTLLDGYINQAVKDVEEFTGRSIANQTLTVFWKLVWDYVWLPRPPHGSITSVTSIDDDGAETAISSTDYDLFGRNQLKIEFDNVIGNQLRVVYKAGYGATEGDLPRWAKSAVAWQTKLYYQKDDQLAINAESGLAVPAWLAAKNHVYLLPE